MKKLINLIAICSVVLLSCSKSSDIATTTNPSGQLYPLNKTNTWNYKKILYDINGNQTTNSYTMVVGNQINYNGKSYNPLIVQSTTDTLYTLRSDATTAYALNKNDNLEYLFEKWPAMDGDTLYKHTNNFGDTDEDIIYTTPVIINALSCFKISQGHFESSVLQNYSELYFAVGIGIIEFNFYTNKGNGIYFKTERDELISYNIK